VPVRFVHHVEARGSESLGQLLRDEIAPGHGVRKAFKACWHGTSGLTV
jgi:hypothetical protein